MKINTIDLLGELFDYVQSHLDFTEYLKTIPDNVLQRKPSLDSWSTLECLEHLNLYGAFYIPEISKRIAVSKTTADPIFRSGYLGNKFALDMLPREGIRTMKTFKSKNPIHSKLIKEKVINTFTEQQKQLLVLLKQAKEKNLTKIKTATTLPFLKLRLGDTLRVVIYHNERHIAQAKKVLGPVNKE